MKSFGALIRVVFIASALASSAAEATVLFSTTSQLVAANPIQIGRLSRNGIPQDWAGSEPYPGIVNPATPYHYTTFLVNVGITPYIQISFDSTATTTFVSAYQTTYNPAALSVNWLGDPGTSGNFFGVDPLFFNVIANIKSFLVVVVNETTTNGGLGLPFGLLVEGFIDATFTEPTAIPEPATMLLCLAALGLLVAQRRMRRDGAPAPRMRTVAA